MLPLMTFRFQDRFDSCTRACSLRDNLHNLHNLLNILLFCLLRAMEVFGFREHILLNVHYSELLKVG